MATIDQLPSGLYRVRIRRRGQRALTRSFVTKQNAAAWARRIESEQERGTWRDLGDADSITLRKALTQYAETETTRHRGRDAEQAHINVIRDDPLAKRTLSTITHAQVESMRDRWQSAGYAVGTINRRLTLLSAVFATAAKKWDMPGLPNPAKGLMLHGATERERRVSDDEIAAICAATRSPYLPAMVRLAVETAMRRGELCSMTWTMIDLKAGVVRLSASITKTAKPRDVPLSPVATDELRVLAEKAGRKGGKVDRVFPVDAHSVSTAFRRAVKRARNLYLQKCESNGADPAPSFLTDLHYHDLRHEATTRLAEVFSLHELMKITGHVTPRMLSRYYNPTAADFAQRLRERQEKAGSAGE